MSGLTGTSTKEQIAAAGSGTGGRDRLAALSENEQSLALNPASAGGKDLNKGGLVYNVLAYGAVADGQQITDGAMTIGVGSDNVLTTAGLATPVNATFATFAAFQGASLLNATTYYYRVSAVNAQGETLASTETSITTPAGTDNKCVVYVKWLAVAGATGYRVYGRSTGAELFITSTPFLVFMDNGSVTPVGALPGGNTTQSSPFTLADVGKAIGVQGALAANSPTGKCLFATITGVTDNQHVTLSANATATVTGASISWGTDNRPVATLAAADLVANGGGTILWPGLGTYFLTYDTTQHIFTNGQSATAAIVLYSRMHIRGHGATLLFADESGTNTIAGATAAIVGASEVGNVPTPISNVSVRGLKLVGGQPIQVENAAFAIVVGPCQRAVFAENEITQFASKAVHVAGDSTVSPPAYASDVWICDNFVHDHPGNVFRVIAAQRVYVTDNIVLNGGHDGGVEALNATTKVSFLTVARNIMVNVGQWELNGSQFLVEDNVMVLQPGGGYCLGLGESTATDHVVVTSNYFDASPSNNNGGIGIEARGITDGEICDNWCASMPVPVRVASGANAINISAGAGGITYSGLAVCNNRCVNGGLKMDGNVSGGAVAPANMTLSGNIVDGDIQVGSSGPVNQISITGNVGGVALSFQGDTTHPHVFSGADQTITGNYLTANQSSNMLSVGGDNQIIMGNRLHNSTLAGGSPRIFNLGGASSAGRRIEHNIMSVATGSLSNNFHAYDVVKDNGGWNPRGKVTAPGFPATGVAQGNTFNSPATVYLSGGTITAMAVGLVTPTNRTFTSAATGGTLLHATQYFYRVTATNAAGETLASAETSLTTGGGADTYTLTVKWLPVPGATGYKVYGRTTGAELLMATISGGTLTSFVDDGSVTPAGALPAGNTTGTATGLTTPGTFRLEPLMGLIPTHTGAGAWVWIVD